MAKTLNQSRMAKPKFHHQRATPVYQEERVQT